MFYSLIGPEGAEFKINELEIEVSVLNVGKTETIELTCGAKKYKKSRFHKEDPIDDACFEMSTSQLALTSIEGLVKWKATAGATLTLKLYKGDQDRPNAVLALAKYPPDESSEDYITTAIDFTAVDCSKEDVFKPRRPGWPGIFPKTIHVLSPAL